MVTVPLRSSDSPLCQALCKAKAKALPTQFMKWEKKAKYVQHSCTVSIYSGFVSSDLLKFKHIN